MAGHQFTVLEDPDLVGKRVDLNHSFRRGVGNAVEIAADADHAIVGDAALEREGATEGNRRHGLEGGFLLGKRLVHHPPRGGVGPRVGNRVEPVPKLDVEVVEIAEAAGEEEVLPDVAEGSLDLAFGLGPVGSAGPRMEPVVPGELDQGAVIDDAAVHVPAGDRCLHTVIEDLLGDAAQGVESGHVAAQHALEILMRDEAGPDQARVAEHQGKEPDDPDDTGLIGEDDLKLSKIDLSLVTRRRLEAALVASVGRWPDRAQEIGDGRIAPLVAALAELAQEPPSGQAWERQNALPQVGLERGEPGESGPPRPIGRRRQALLDVLADRLAVNPELTGNGRDAQALSVQIKDHHEFPKSDHRPSLPPFEREHR
jgi:hypothetical protein